MASFKNTFTDLGDFNTQTLQDDFVSKTLFTNKIKAKTANNGNLSYKHKTNFNEKASRFEDTREIKLDFPLTSRYFLWYGIRDKGDIKVHLDLGNLKVGNRDFNVFTNIKANAERTNFSYRLGALFNFDNVQGGIRLESDCCDPSTICATEKLLISKNNFYLGGVATVGLTDLKFCRLDGVVGFSNNKFDFFARHLAGDSCSPCSPKDTHSSLLGKLVFDAVYQHNDRLHIAVQAEENYVQNSRSISLGHLSQIGDKITLRNRLTDQLQWGLSLQYRFSNLFTFTVSSNIDFKSDKPVNFDQQVPFPIGFQTEFSI